MANRRNMFAIVLLSLLGTISAFAQSNYIVLELSSGEQIKFTVDDNPQFTYGDKTVSFTATDFSAEYDMADIEKLRIEDADISTGISMVKADKSKESSASSYGGVISFSGCKSGSQVNVYTNSGMLVESYPISDDGTLDIDINSYASGLYIFKTDGITYKLNKK